MAGGFQAAILTLGLWSQPPGLPGRNRAAPDACAMIGVAAPATRRRAASSSAIRAVIVSLVRRSTRARRPWSTAISAARGGPANITAWAVQQERSP